MPPAETRRPRSSSSVPRARGWRRRARSAATGWRRWRRCRPRSTTPPAPSKRQPRGTRARRVRSRRHSRTLRRNQPPRPPRLRPPRHPARSRRRQVLRLSPGRRPRQARAATRPRSPPEPHTGAAAVPPAVLLPAGLTARSFRRHAVGREERPWALDGGSGSARPRSGSRLASWRCSPRPSRPPSSRATRLRPRWRGPLSARALRPASRRRGAAEGTATLNVSTEPAATAPPASASGSRAAASASRARSARSLGPAGSGAWVRTGLPCSTRHRRTRARPQRASRRCSSPSKAPRALPPTRSCPQRAIRFRRGNAPERRKAKTVRRPALERAAVDELRGSAHVQLSGGGVEPEVQGAAGKLDGDRRARVGVSPRDGRGRDRASPGAARLGQAGAALPDGDLVPLRLDAHGELDVRVLGWGERGPFGRGGARERVTPLRRLAREEDQVRVARGDRRRLERAAAHGEGAARADAGNAHVNLHLAQRCGRRGDEARARAGVGVEDDAAFAELRAPLRDHPQSCAPRAVAAHLRHRAVRVLDEQAHLARLCRQKGQDPVRADPGVPVAEADHLGLRERNLAPDLGPAQVPQDEIVAESVQLCEPHARNYMRKRSRPPYFRFLDTSPPAGINRKDPGATALRTCPECQKSFDDEVPRCPQDGRTLGRALPQDPLVGRTIGSYRVVRQLGKGGMGAVYLAEHPVIGSPSPRKFLPPPFSPHPGGGPRFFLPARARERL